MDSPIWDEAAELDDPLDVVERVLLHEKCEFDRSDDGDICFMLPGTWRDYDAWFCWKPEFESLHLNIAFDMRAPKPRAADVSRLISMINEKLWLGHFDIWTDDGAIVFRAGAPFHDTGGPSPSQVAAMTAAGLEAVERFYPALNYLLWAGQTPEEALASAMFETAGRA